MQNKTKKFIAAVLIFSFLLSIMPKPTHAGAWGEDMMAVIWKQTRFVKPGLITFMLIRIDLNRFRFIPLPEAGMVYSKFLASY